MSKRTRWLSSEINRWTSEAIISREQGSRILGLYEEAPAGVSWGMVVFSGIGAVVVGLGVILLFAHNWKDIPKFGKLGIVFTLLIASHAGGISMARHPGWRRQLGEALCVLGTMAFGAGIWLVAQIYNIDEHYPAGFLTWTLGALAMAWAMKSVPQAFMATVLLVIWNGAERMDFDTAETWTPLLILAGLFALAWRQRSVMLTAHVLVALYLVLLFNESLYGGPDGAWGTAFALSVLLIATGGFMGGNPSTARLRQIMASFGVLGFFVGSYLHSFKGWGDWRFERVDLLTGNLSALAYHWVPLALAMSAWVWLLVRMLRGSRGLVPAGAWIFPIALFYNELFGASSSGVYNNYTAPLENGFDGYSGPFVVFNLVCLILAIGLMVRGCRDSNLKQTVRGSIFFTLVVFARYFDLPGSLETRGFVFIFLGGVLFAEGFYYRKLQRAKGEERRP